MKNQKQFRDLVKESLKNIEPTQVSITDKIILNGYDYLKIFKRVDPQGKIVYSLMKYYSGKGLTVGKSHSYEIILDVFWSMFSEIDQRYYHVWRNKIGVTDIIEFELKNRF